MTRSQKIFSGLLLIAGVAVGIFLLIYSIGGMNGLFEVQKETVGTVVAYDYDEDDSTMYQPIYEYAADGAVYRVKANYYHEEMRIGETDTIYYLTLNPSDATFDRSTNDDLYLSPIFRGILFIAVPLIITLGYLAAIGRLKAIGTRLFELLIGVVLIFAGLGVVWLMTGNFDLLALLSRIGPFALIPLLLIVAGIWQVIRLLLPKRKKAEDPDTV